MYCVAGSILCGFLSSAIPSIGNVDEIRYEIVVPPIEVGEFYINGLRATWLEPVHTNTGRNSDGTSGLEKQG